MKVTGIMTVRDEEDILHQSVEHAVRAFDRVISVDCGSLDRTPDILKGLANRFSNLVFLGSIEPMTPMQVKRHIWSAFKSTMSHRDWWVFSDADEFVDAENYRSILSYASSSQHDHIYGEHVNFYYTETDYAKWISGEESLESRTIPIEERRKYYRFHTQQIRFFRNLPWLRWNFDSEFPENISCLSDRRVQFTHYQYRDVPQIENRIKIRKGELHRTHGSNTHWRKTALQEAISPDTDANLRFHDGREYVRDHSLMPLGKQALGRTVLKYGRNVVRGFLTQDRKSGWFKP